MEKQNVEISWAAVAKFFLLAVLIFAVYYFRDLIALFISAVVIATVVEGPTSTLMRRGIPRFLAVTFIYLAFLVAVGFFAYFVASVLVDEFRGFTESMFAIVNHILRFNFLTNETITQAQVNVTNLLQGFGQGAGAAFDVLSRFTNVILSIAVVFITSFYLALQGKTVERIIRILTPDKYELYALGLWGRVERKISRWFYGQVLLSILIGIAVFIGLWLLGVNYPLLIASIAALLEVVPIVGPVIFGLIGVTIAANQGVDLAIYTLTFFVIIQQLESNILVPMIMRRSIGLNPVAVVFALLIGGRLAGLWGIILAVPLTAALGELLSDWEHKRLLRTA